MDTDSIATKERKVRKELLPLRLERGEGQGEVSSLHFGLSCSVAHATRVSRPATRRAQSKLPRCISDSTG